MNKLIKSAGLILALFAFSFSSCKDDDPKVLGLNSAAKYGNIKIVLEGTRPDGQSFTTTKNFKFMAEDGPYNSEVDLNFEGDYDFFVRRWNGAVDNYYNDNYADLRLSVNKESGEMNSAQFYLITSVINTDDNTYFYLDDFFYPTRGETTEYSFNEDTGKLKYSFTTTSTENDSGYELMITVDVNVTVFRNIGFESE